MFRRFEVFEEIGRFAVLKHEAPQFDAFTLIFARNGFGKSTICAVLRSAVERDPSAMTARRRLGGVAESRVAIKWESARPMLFSAGKWSSGPEFLHVFDQDYVNRNLYVGDQVTRQNKRSLLPVILGQEGVALMERIAALDQAQKDIAARQAAAERSIRAACPVVDDVSAFAGAPVPDDIDAQIASAEKRLQFRQQIDAVRMKADPTRPFVPPMGAIETLANRDVSTISDQAAVMVDAHLDAHDMTNAGQRWLAFGVRHMTGDACPFCAQDTNGNPLVEAYKGYFSAEVEALVQAVTAEAKSLRDGFGLSGEMVLRAFDSNAEDFEFWDKVGDLTDVPALTADQRTAMIGAYGKLIDLLERKQARPLERHCIDQADRDAVRSAMDGLERYDEMLVACSVQIQAMRTASEAGDLVKAREVLDKRKALKAKQFKPLQDEVSAWLAANGRRSEIERDKKAAQGELRAFVNRTVGARQAEINSLLSLFGANFRLSETRASFVGREPNTDFSIAIGGHVVKAGERLIDTPSFGTVLSEGDKFTLAFAFFLVQVRSDPDLKLATVIFDDPYRSQDMDRQWQTAGEIRRLSPDVTQVIVLSHDPRFLDLIDRNVPGGTCQTFQIQCDDAGSGEIRPLVLSDELKSRYVRQSERIREYAGCGKLLPDVTAESLAAGLRPFLEDFLQARFPGRFGRDAMLDGMISAIEQAGPGDPAYENVSVYRGVDQFSRENIQGGAANPGPAALRAQCQSIVKAVWPC